jgi:hypothetical protein
MFAGQNGVWSCFARVREDEGQLIFYSYRPITVAANQLLPVSEYINRANFGMHIGNFELDYENRTVQFRTSVDVEGQEEILSSRLIKHLVYQNILTMDRYLPGLCQSVVGQLAPDGP